MCADVVEEHHVGSAYGAIISLGVRACVYTLGCTLQLSCPSHGESVDALAQNLALAGLPMALAVMYRIDERYLPNAPLLLSVVGFCAFVASCLMLHFDDLDGHVLNPPTPKILTKAQAVARSFDETDFLLDFYDDRHHAQEELSLPSRPRRSHRA